MKVLFVHNNYRISAGEDLSIQNLIGLCIKNGLTVETFIKDSSDIGLDIISKSKILFNSISNKKVTRELSQKLDAFKPDIVFIQNLYPLISLEAIKLIKSRNIPIIMRCPNYRLFCPIGLFFDSKDKVCEKCAETRNEIWCFIKRCEERNYLKSAVYSIRNAYARINKTFSSNVDLLIVQSDFQKQKFIHYGISEKKIGIIPGLSFENELHNYQLGSGVTFVGRIERSKGIHTLIKAAKKLPHIPFKIAGGPSDSQFIDDLPNNVEYLGYLDKGEVKDLLIHSRIIVVPSEWYEGFPNSITQAMFKKKVVITTNLGAMSSIIEHNKNGILFKPGDANELASIIDDLYEDEVKLRKMGENAYHEAKLNYSPNSIFSKLEHYFNSILN